jgi:hypothetical protein
VLLKDKAGENIGNTIIQKGTALPSVPYPFTFSLNPKGDLTPGAYTAEISIIREDGTVMDTDEMNIDI